MKSALLDFMRLSLKLWILVFFLTLIIACAADAQSKPVLGDYGPPPLRGNHADADLLIRRLANLGANTFMWLIYQNRNDWEDLKVFLPKADRSGITVWAYLVPHSETPIQDERFRKFSEPFGLDYIRWAKEIAKLSLQYSNLKGYVIDDFWDNVRPDRFSPNYIRRMIAAGKGINPEIKFYPLMYYNQIDLEFSDVLAPLIDGVVAAYPRDRKTVERALIFLEDRYHIPHNAKIEFPERNSSRRGDHGFIYQNARVINASHSHIRFHYRDTFDGSTHGYHQFQVRIDDKVVWEEDVAGYDDATTIVDLARFINNKSTVKLSLGVFDLKGVGNFPINASFSDLTVQGLDLKNVDLEKQSNWHQDIKGSFSVRFENERVGARRFHLPLIVMSAGMSYQYRKRYEDDPTPDNIARRVKMAIDLAEKGRIEGVVIFKLDKDKGSPIFSAVRRVFRSTK